MYIYNVIYIKCVYDIYQTYKKNIILRLVSVYTHPLIESCQIAVDPLGSILYIKYVACLICI